MDVEDWRKKIDELDDRLLDLLNQRAHCALEVGRIKRASGQPIYVPARETAILGRLGRINAGPLSNEAVARLFRQVIDETRRLEQEHGNR